MIIKEIRKQLNRIIEDIDSGNSNIEKEDAEELLSVLVRVGEGKLSKYQAMKYINCSNATFDRLVASGKIPEGKRQIGFKEKFWLKSDIDDYIKNNKK